MRTYILDSQTNRMLFIEAAKNTEIPGRRGPGFSVPVVVKKITNIAGIDAISLQDVHPATASFSVNHRGRNFTSYKAGVKCNYVIRVWPKKI